MITITVRGDTDLRDNVMRLAANAQTSVQITDEQGLDGSQVIQVVLEYGLPAVALIKSILELIEISDRLRKKWSIEINNESSDKDSIDKNREVREKE